MLVFCCLLLMPKHCFDPKLLYVKLDNASPVLAVILIFYANLFPNWLTEYILQLDSMISIIALF